MEKNSPFTWKFFKDNVPTHTDEEEKAVKEAEEEEDSPLSNLRQEIADLARPGKTVLSCILSQMRL